MKKFKYIARDSAGKEYNGTLEAKDEMAVADILHDKGLVVVSVKASNSIDWEKLNEINIGGIPSKDKVIFMRQMSTMIAAGLSITKALEIMIQQVENPKFKSVVREVLASVESGKPLSVAFREQDKVFDTISLNLIQAGEESGNLNQVFDRLATELEASESLRKKIQSAMIYPIIIVVLIIAVIAIMMVVMVPAMSDIYSDFDTELPWVTRVLVAMSNFFVGYWWAVLLVLVLLVVIIKAYLDTEKGKQNFDKLIIKTPIVGPLIKKIQIAQFTRILALLLNSGLAIVKALDLTAMALSNTVFREGVTVAKNDVEKGGSLAIPIGRNPNFPLLVSSMISVGEETGEIGSVLNKVAEYYQEDVNNATDNISSLLEPVFLVIMGLAVGFIALGVYMPMFELSSAIG